MNEEFKNVTEEVAENTEAQTVEQTEEGIELTDTAEVEEIKEADSIKETEEEKPQGRYVTEDELNEIVDKRVARKMSKLDKELSKYKDTDNVLKKALQVKDDEDVNEKLREYYENNGIEVPIRQYNYGLSSREIEAIANLEANDIIEEGNDAMINEANRLASIGYQNLNEKERFVFNKLAETLTNEKNKTELKSLGAKEEILSNNEFKNFMQKFNSNVPIKEIYEMYMSNKPKPKVENPGSMKNRQEQNAVKEFYTKEEARKFSIEDLNKNPKLVQAIEKSMLKW